MKYAISRSVGMLCAASLLVAGLAAQAQASSVGVPLSQAFGPPYRPNPNVGPEHLRYRTPAAYNDTTARIVYWDQMAVDAIMRDHAPITPTSYRIYGEQGGPTHTSRAMAIVALAMFDALNAIVGRYPSYTGLPRAPGDSSPDAAVAQAAHDTIVALWPAQQARYDQLLAADLARIPAGRAKYNGIDLGHRSAAAILALRANDNSDNTDLAIGSEYIPSNAPGKWRPDPVSMNPTAVGAKWGQVHPFVVPNVLNFRVAPPPALTSSAYSAAFNEVKSLGADGKSFPTTRTVDQTVVGVYWSFDSTPWVGTPVGMYNEMMADMARPRIKDALEMAHMMALVNVAIADTVIATWNDKFYYDVWRPITAIREAAAGSGPTGKGDGNPNTRGDPDWTPYGAQASNLYGPDFTPPFPSYPSGHAGMTGALFQMMRHIFGTDRVGFTFVSNEWNGVTRDNTGHVRPLKPRTYSSLSQAETEAGLSRIYLGVHWHFDLASTGQGEAIANYVFSHGLVAPDNVVGCQCHH